MRHPEGDSLYFDRKETRPVAQRHQDQGRKLARMARGAYWKSSRVRQMFDEAGIDPSKIRSLRDLESIPIVSRGKLIEMEMEEPPYGGFNDAEAAVDRVFVSPGPVYEPHLSEKDILWARAYWAAGFRPEDVVLNAFSYHLVAAGLTFHGGLRRVGATVVPSGTSSSDIQAQLLRDLKITGYTGTPSFLMAILRRAEELGLHVRRDFRLRRASFAAEPLEASLREKFEKHYAIDTYQMYGATEVGDVAYECAQKKGWHICEEVIVEIVDPETGKGVEPGQMGEVVVTRPNDILYLFRFATGDLSSLIVEPCPCGRTSMRLAGVAGRVGDAVKVRGMFVSPSQLKKVGESLPDIKFRVLIDRHEHRDLLTVQLEPLRHEAGADALRARFEKTFQSLCTVKIDRVEFTQPGTLEGESGRLVDRREWK